MLLSVLIWNMHTLRRGMATVYKYLAVFAAFSVHAAVSLAVYLKHFVLRTLCCVFVCQPLTDRQTSELNSSPGRSQRAESRQGVWPAPPEADEETFPCTPGLQSLEPTVLSESGTLPLYIYMRRIEREGIN